MTELAALGPGIQWIDNSAYMLQVLAMFTTNKIAMNLSDQAKTKISVSHSLSISLVLGILLMAVQSFFAEYVVTILSGSASATVPFAVKYSQIRAFAAPAATLTMVAQAAFLATKDAVTPLKAVVIGAVANIVFDLYFVCHLKKGTALRHCLCTL